MCRNVFASKQVLFARSALNNKKSQILKAARDKCGFSELRPGQEEAIHSVLDGTDTLVVQPTGSGKSAIYQIAGALLEGPAIIVSPLIALQKDQVDSINELPASEAALVNSTLRVAEFRTALDKLASGELGYLLLAPEQFRNPDTLERIRAAKPGLFVVDEAHCISEWGHDFRPDYLKLGAVIESLEHPVVLALTATAAPRVREEIIERLAMRKPAVIVRGFDRPNIHLEVRTFESQEAKLEALLNEVDEAEKPGIVYVATRKHAEMLGDAFSDRGVRAVYYHGGMKAKERSQIQDEYMNDGADVIIATSAFGMGVDKANVRFVFHYDISDSIDSYYQEIGRAGRDGNPARAILFYRPEDLSLQKFFKGGGKLEEQHLQQVATAILHESGPIDREELQKKTDLSERKLVKALHRLEETGAVEALPSGEVVAAEEAPPIQEAVKAAADAQKEHKDYEHLRIEKMRLYAELRSCRREYLLHYFGEDASAQCGNCDVCDSPETLLNKAETRPTESVKPASTPDAAQNAKFPLKTRVVHKEWGKGVVESYDIDKINVIFDEVGPKVLSMKAVLEHGLLESAA